MSRLTLDERFCLVTKCRQSGLSAHRWCIENHIPSGTFYSWIDQLKKANYVLPELSKQRVTYKQDVVELSIIPEQLPGSYSTKQLNEYTTGTTISNDAVMEITVGKLSLKINNHMDPTLLGRVMSQLGEFIC